MTRGTFMRHCLTFATLAVGAVCSLVTSASAQKPSRTTATYGDWLVQCGTPNAAGAGQKSTDKNAAEVLKEKSAPSPSQQKICEMVQVFTIRETGKQLARLAIGKPNAESGLTAVLHLPIGVFLGNAPILKLGATDAVDGQFVRCLPAFCVAKFNVTADMIKAVTEKSTSELIYVGAAGKQIKVIMSGKGFQDAFAAIQK